MLVDTYREVFFKPQDMEFEDDEWDNFEEELPEEEQKLEKIDSWEAEAQMQEQQNQEKSVGFEIKAKSEIHKYGFKIFDYQLNSKSVQERFTQSLFWLELA